MYQLPYNTPMRATRTYHNIHIVLVHVLITLLPTRLALELAYHRAREVRRRRNESGAGPVQLAEGHEAVQVRAEGGQEGREGRRRASRRGRAAARRRRG